MFWTMLEQFLFTKWNNFLSIMLSLNKNLSCFVFSLGNLTTHIAISMVNGVVLYSNSVSLKAFSFKSCSLYWQPFRCQFALKPPSLSTAMQTSSATQGVRTLFNWIYRFWSQLIRYDKNFRSFQKLKERNDFFGLVPKPTKWLVQTDFCCCPTVCQFYF